MSSIRLYNARYVTMAEPLAVEWGEVWVDNGKISYIGPSVSQHPPFEQSINLNGNLILPGFKNAHAHSPMVFLRSFADDLPLLDWLHQQVFPMEAKLEEEDAYYLTKLAIMEYLTSGITSSFDMYLYPWAIARAARDVGFRVVLCGAVNDFTHNAEILASDYLKLNQFHSLVGAQLGFHAEYTTSESLLREISDISHSYKAPVYTHLAESKTETQECIAKTGKTPTEYLDSLGIWDYGGGGFHCIHMTEHDLSIFEEKKLSVVTNPASNLKLSSGIPRLCEMQKRNIPIGIGTDGAASNNALDFFREMYLTTTLQKLITEDPAAMDAYEVLHMATVTGAEIMGLENTDILATGKNADLIVLDLNQPNMQPYNNILKNVVYSGSKKNVLLTMINGKILYHKGDFFLDCDPAELYTITNKIIKKLSK